MPGHTSFIVEGEEIFFTTLTSNFIMEMSVHPGQFMEWGKDKSWRIIEWANEHWDTIFALIVGAECRYDEQFFSMDRFLLVMESPIISQKEKDDIKKAYEQRRNLPRFRNIEKPIPKKIPGYIYIAGIGEQIKIGRTKNIEKRVRDLSKNQPSPLSLHFYIETNDTVNLEKKLHEHFHHKRLNGEWFALSQEESCSIRELSFVHENSTGMSVCLTH